VVAATMTAFYMFRLYFLTFSGEYRGGPEHAHDDHAHDDHDDHGHGEPHESPATMTFPLVVLGTGAVICGYLWVGLVNVLDHDAHFEPWVTWLEPALGSIGHADHSNAIYAVIFGTAAAVVGIGLAYSWYFKPSEAPARLAASFPRTHQFFFDKWRVDELYEATILSASRGLGIVLAGFDKAAIDGLFARATSLIVQAASFLFTRIQTGVVHTYGGVMVLGMLGVAWWFMVPHVKLIASKPEGAAVKLVAGAGLGYEYRWDFDTDGEYDTEWSTEREQTHDYAGQHLAPEQLVVFLTPASSGVFGTQPREIALGIGDTLELDASDLGAWQADATKSTLPHISVHEDGVHIRLNDAKVSQAVGPEVTLTPGQSMRLGDARLTIGLVARATVVVRNAFGYERSATEHLHLITSGNSDAEQPHAALHQAIEGTSR
jgi:hypothetical protein